MQDKEAELDTLRKAGKNLRERLDEKEVETRGIMDRVRLPQGFDATVLRLSVVALLSDPLVVLGTCLHSYAFIYGRFKYGCLTLIRLRVLLYGRFYERLAHACLSCPLSLIVCTFLAQLSRIEETGRKMASGGGSCACSVM